LSFLAGIPSPQAKISIARFFYGVGLAYVIQACAFQRYPIQTRYSQKFGMMFRKQEGNINLLKKRVGEEHQHGQWDACARLGHRAHEK